MPTGTAAGHRRRLAALAFVMLLPSLGTSIANVALPSLAVEFAATTADVQWVVIAYLLSVTSLVVTAGGLGDMIGRRRLLIAGVAIFTAGSSAAAVAPELWALIAARGIQGVGAALMMSLTVAMVGDLVPKERTGSAMGLLGSVSAVGTALGPSLGGALLAVVGWPSVFATLGLLGAIALGLAARVLPPESRARDHGQPPIDWAGIGLLSLALAAYALSTTIRADLITTLGLAGAAVLGLVAFVVVEAKSASPLVQLSMLKNRELSSALAALALVSAIVMATLVVGPFYLSDTLGLAPMQVGLVMTVGPAVAALTGMPAGRLVDRFGSRSASLAGLVGVVCGSALMALLPVALGVAGYVGSLAVITASYSAFQAANNAAVIGGATAGRRGVASALLALSRNVGLVTGASALGAIYAAGSHGFAPFGLPAGGDTGLGIVFAVAGVLGALAIGLVLRGRPHARLGPFLGVRH